MNDDYTRIARAIQYLEQNFQRQPDLREIAQSVGLSEFHFQRLFRRWAGISPKRFVQFLTLEYAKRMLERSHNLLDATYDTGLSSPSRLHHLFVSIEAMTPGEFKKQGAGLNIRYGFHPTPFGECLLAVTGRGICGLGFIGKGGRADTLRDLRSRFKQARFAENSQVTRPYADRIFRHARNDDGRPLTLVLKGTNFQIKVWEALLKVPMGSLTCYEELARSIGKPTASRAVGTAVGRNPVAYIIPCHRAIRKAGVIGDYHWGGVRKKAMLVWEAAQAAGESD